MAHLQGGSLSTVSRSNWNLKVLDLKDFVRCCEIENNWECSKIKYKIRQDIDKIIRSTYN